jgi:diguanylate cyclase (GGDEF)-like protein
MLKTGRGVPNATGVSVVSPAADPVCFDGTPVALDPDRSTPESLAELLYQLELHTAQDFRAAAGPAAQAERIAGRNGWTALAMRARLVLGDVLGREGDVAEQGRIAKAVNLWAERNHDSYLLARSHRLLAIFFRRLGDAAEALAQAVQSVEHAGGLPPRIRGSNLVTLALVLDLNGSFDEAARRFAEALEIATAHDDPYAILTVLNNMAFTAYENEDEQAALDLVRRMRAIEDRYGVPLDGLYLDTIARISMMLGRYAEVETILEPVLRDRTGPLVTEGDALPECLLTVAEAQRLAGHPERARATLDDAGQLCAERGLAAVAARVHEARAELHAAVGDFQVAFEEYRLFHAETEALRSAQREMRARALHAVFETSEARRASEHFRQMALRDALTGLWNRRYVDERLPVLIAEAAERGLPLSVALVDLDFFKKINDTLSHAVGDQVLQQVATVLGEVVGEPQLVARIGGEEFLLVLPGADAAAAVARCEAVAEAVRRHPWHTLTGSLPVTTSIGVTTHTGGPVTGSALLSAADRNLYEAKRGGRDRVIADN